MHYVRPSTNLEHVLHMLRKSFKEGLMMSHICKMKRGPGSSHCSSTDKLAYSIALDTYSYFYERERENSQPYRGKMDPVSKGLGVSCFAGRDWVEEPVLPER